MRAKSRKRRKKEIIRRLRSDKEKTVRTVRGDKEKTPGKVCGDKEKTVRKARGGKKKKRNRLNAVIIIVALAVMAFASYHLVSIFLDYKQADDTYAEITEEYVEVPTDVEDEGTYDWTTVQIDFERLKAQNPDVVGWIRFDNLDAVAVDYPILHGEDNDEYLHTDINGESHTAGSIFLEAANTADFSDYYNIIYGHNMKNLSMFGSLKKYKQEENFYEENSCFAIYTPTGAYRYQIFAYEDVADDSNIYSVGYQPDEQYQSLIDQIVADSMIDTGVVPTNEDKIVALSTCSTSGDTWRFVVYAVQVDQVLYE